MTTLEAVLAGLRGDQMVALALKVWTALGGKESGAEGVRRLLAGELRLTVQEVIQSLFAHDGRRIPRDLKARVCDPNRDFFLSQPGLDYGQMLTRLMWAFGEEHLAGFGNITPTTFETRCNAALAKLGADPHLANLIKGVYLPIVIPRTTVGDYGTVMEEMYLAALARAYTAAFPDRAWKNWRAGELARQVTVVDDGHQRLVDALALGPVAGILFPNPLQGFSVNAQREQMVLLPKEFSLGGGPDWATATIAYPDTLARDGHTPAYDLSALQWRSSGCSLCLNPRAAMLAFGLGASLGAPCEIFSGGLFLRV